MLSFATRTPTLRQIRARTLGGALPSVATSDSRMSLETIIDETRPVKKSTNLHQKFLSFLAIKDAIDDNETQHGLILIERHYSPESAKTGSEIVE